MTTTAIAMGSNAHFVELAPLDDVVAAQDTTRQFEGNDLFVPTVAKAQMVTIQS